MLLALLQWVLSTLNRLHKLNGNMSTVPNGNADFESVRYLLHLLLGEFTQGRIRFYQNSGTNSAPVFTTFAYLEADGATITLPYG